MPSTKDLDLKAVDVAAEREALDRGKFKGEVRHPAINMAARTKSPWKGKFIAGNFRRHAERHAMTPDICCQRRAATGLTGWIKVIKHLGNIV
jgi:hypothetical protein